MKKLIFSLLVATSFLHAGGSNDVVGSGFLDKKTKIKELGVLVVKWEGLTIQEKFLVDGIVMHNSTIPTTIEDEHGVLIDTHSLPNSLMGVLVDAKILSSSTKFIFIEGYKF